jgi:hypothetical protein
MAFLVVEGKGVAARGGRDVVGLFSAADECLIPTFGSGKQHHNPFTAIHPSARHGRPRDLPKAKKI